MRFKYLFLIIIGISVVGVALVQYYSDHETPWIMPGDVKNTTTATQVDYNDFAYQSFIALNWPAKQGEGSNRGEPDTTKKLGAQGQVVWMTYKRPSEVFLENAKTPNDWNAPPPPPPSNCPPEAAKATIFYRAAKASDKTIDELTQAGFPGGDELMGALVDQNQEYVWYELAFNQSWFEYILKYQFYNAKEQEKYTTTGDKKIPALPKTGQESDLPLPSYAQQGVVEIKASWRILKDNDIKERYYRTQGYIVDPQGNCDPKPKDMGLVGLHILRLTTTTPNTWFWATFEQVDNVEINGTPPTQSNGQSLTPSFNPGPDGTKPPPYLGGYIINGKMTELPKPLPAGQPLPPIDERPKVNVSRLHNIPENATTADAKYRDKLKDTVWQYYHLVGTQTPITSDVSPERDCWVAGHNTPEDGTIGEQEYKINACNLANTTMETYVQGTSCVECHAYAAPIGDQGVKTKTSDKLFPMNQIFTFMLLNAKRP